MSQASHAEFAIPANPFPGLRPFEFDESYLFFGRAGQSERLVEKLRRQHFVAVVGTSGSGKSSLVRAGLLPLLYGGLMPGRSSAWRVALLRPGNDPLGNLARALAEPDALGAAAGLEQQMHTALLEATLRRGELGLIEATRQAQLAAHESLLVIADQFEELFRVGASAKAQDVAGELADNQAAFVKLLLAAAQHELHELPIYVVLTMRSDYLGDCTQFQGLPEAINESQYLIPRLTRDERRAVIEGPVAVGGAEIKSSLVNRLLNDVGDNPDQLPILQHALMRTWEKWQAESETASAAGAARAPLDLSHYQAIGGLAAALSQHADEAYAEVGRKLGEKGQRLTEHIFRALTEKGADQREVRRPCTLRQLCQITGASAAEVSVVIEIFHCAGRSFLTLPTGKQLNDDTLIDISHESLIRNWKGNATQKRLREWVEAEARSARLYRRLAETTTLYQKGEAGLWRGPDLQTALAWQKREQPNEAWAQRYQGNFVESLRFLEQSRRARIWRRFAILSLVIVSSLLVFAAWQKQLEQARAEQEKDRAERRDRDNSQVVYLLYELLYDEDDPARTTKRLAEADQYYRQTKNEVGRGVVLASLGEAYFRDAQDSLGYSQAREYYEQALSRLEAKLGREHVYVARTHAQLAQALAKLAEHNGLSYVAAESQFQAALALQERILGDEGAAVGDTLNGLAALYQAMGPNHYYCAERLFQRALAIHTAAYGAKHPQLAVDFNYLAALAAKQGASALAYDRFKQTLDILNELLADQADQGTSADPLTSKYLYQYRIQVATNLAELLWSKQRYAEAEPFYLQALRYNQALASRKHENQQAFYQQMRETLARQEDALHRQSRAYAEAVAPSLYNLAYNYLDWQQYAQAIERFEQALVQHKLLLDAARQDQTQAQAREAVADDLYGLGLCYRKQKKFAEAERKLLGALAYHHNLQAEASVADDLYQLALCAAEQQKLDAALEYYQYAQALQLPEAEAFDPAEQNILGALAQAQKPLAQRVEARYQSAVARGRALNQ